MATGSVTPRPGKAPTPPDPPPNDFNASTNYNGEPAKVDGPSLNPAVGGGGQGKGKVSVDTDALATFVTNLKPMTDALVAARADVQAVNIRPGTFGVATTLTQKIMGSISSSESQGVTGLKPATEEFLTRAIEMFADLEDDIATVRKRYDSVAEFGEMTAQELNNSFTESFRGITGFGSTK